ncbi:glycosyltransferase, partial [Lactobacillus helveticus]
MKISILMSTYNGEKYLEDQIKSLKSQTWKEWDLYVR